MKEAIQKAIEGGWKEGYLWKPVNSTVSHDNEVFISFDTTIQLEISKYKIVCDPLFWQALGKAEGWKPLAQAYVQRGSTTNWFFQWHRFIDHLAEGKDVDLFFKELLTNKTDK